MANPFETMKEAYPEKQALPKGKAFEKGAIPKKIKGKIPAKKG